MHQAQYLVRMYLSARAAGVDYSTQYDFRDDGSNRSYTEENFGLLHQDYSPKPSLLAVAAMTRLVGQGRFVRDAAPDPATARAYVFDVGGTAVVCAYAVEKDTKLTLSVGTDRLEQADLMGNRSPLAAPGGRVTLDLTERPIYLVGARLVSLRALDRRRPQAPQALLGRQLYCRPRSGEKGDGSATATPTCDISLAP